MSFIRPIAMLALLAGCSGGEAPCNEIETEVGPSEPTSVGLTTEEVAAAVVGTRTSTLGSHDADPTALTIEVNWSGEDGTWVRRSPNADEVALDGAEYEAVCVDAVQLPVTVVFRTADGRFDETWQIDLEAAADAAPLLRHSADPERLHGTWRPTVAGYADLWLEVEGTITADSTSGVLRLRAISADGAPDELWDIAVWPAR